MSRSLPPIFPGQQRHGIRFATAGDVASAIKELLWDFPEKNAQDPRTFVSTYCDENGNEWPAITAGDPEDVWAIAGDGIEINVATIPLILKTDARVETRRFRLLVRDHSICQDKIPDLFQVVRTRLFPDMTMTPLSPDQDLQIQRANWVIDFTELSDRRGRGVAKINV